MAEKSQAEKRSDKAEQPNLMTSEQVTYLPGPEDPVSTKWRGITFMANVPKTVTNQDLIEQAKRNRHFKVGPFDPNRDAVKTREVPKAPKTAEQYRAHAIAWAKTMETVHDFDARWASEEMLRIDCGMGTEDLDLLNSVIGPIKGDLQKRGQV